MTVADLKNRVWGVGNKVFTVLGAAAGLLVAAGEYLDIIPPEYRSNKWYAVAAGLVAAGAWFRRTFPGEKPATPPVAPVVLAFLLGSLLFAPPAQAEEPDLRPATLCAIGSTNAWCFGILPTVTAFGVDVRHGKVVGNFQAGASVAATWHPGKLESLTFGGHWGFGTANDGLPTTFNLGATASCLKGYLTLIADWQAIGAEHGFILMPALGLPL